MRRIILYLTTMKKLFLIGMLLATRFLGVNADVDPNFYIYICFGQSNMEGNADIENIDRQNIDDRFRLLATCDFSSPTRTKGNWYKATPPLVSPTGKLGPTDYFGRTMCQYLPKNVRIGVIPVAMGGSPIEMFDKDQYQQKLADNPDEWWATLAKNHYGGNPYGRIIEMAKEAQKVGVIKGILLHQGCSNNGDSNWPNMVKKIYNDMLADLGLNTADVPLFVGETLRQEQGGGCYHHNAQVARMPSVIANSYVISSEGCTGNGKDAWHFNAAGYRKIGRRYAAAALKLMGITISDTPSQSGKLFSLHVDGKWLVDTHGNHVVLHGVMDTPSMWFNGYQEGSNHISYWSGGYNATGATNCLNYFEKVFTALEQANCDVFRLHLDPAWTNDPNSNYTYSGSVGQSSDAKDEADISKFNPERLKTFMESVYYPLMQKAMNHGMYVVVRPPGVCPGDLKVGDYYQQYLMTVWDYVSSYPGIQKYAGQISLELANEPVSIKNASGQDDSNAMHDYFQPIVDKIRANGFTGILWIPGTGWQSQYGDYKTHPITGYNIGYAVHDYDGWYGCADKNLTADNLEQAKQNKINQFHNQVPVVDTNPIIITEIDWSPTKPGAGHYNEHGTWVESNYGTWATGRTSMWGTVYKAVHDHYGNISMTLSGSACLIDIQQLLDDGSVVPAFGGLEEACGKACMDWYADWALVNNPVPDNIIEEKTPIKLTGTVGNPTIVPYGSSTMDNLYAATFTPTDDLQNMFQYLDMEVGDHDYIVIKFAEPVPGGWNIHGYGIRDIYESLAGRTEYWIPLNGKPVDDFTIFNWFGCRSSITVTECYFVDEIVTQIVEIPELGEAVNDLSYLTSGGKFVMGNDAGRLIYFEGDQDAKYGQYDNLTESTFCYYTLTKVEGSGASGDVYAVNIINADGVAYPAPYNLGSNLNITSWGSLFSGSAQAGVKEGYGTDGHYWGLWRIRSNGNGGFSFQNVGRERYVKMDGTQESEVFLKLHKSINFKRAEIVIPKKKFNQTNDQLFAVSKMQNGGWMFDESASLSDWDYLMIATANSGSNASHEIAITDVNGTVVKGEDYIGKDAGTGNKMWLDRWNNQNIIRISIDYLREKKLLDVDHIKSLTISGDIDVSCAYLTDYNNTKVNGGYAGGDVVREYSTAGKIGTICLPYRAAVAGARIYKIVGASSNAIGLDPVEGLLEPGTPYIYIGTDTHGQNNEGKVFNVNFFRADLSQYDVTAPVDANGLVGTFTGTTVPQGDDILVLSNGNLYYTTGATVSLGANRAYIDRSQIQDVAAGRLFLGCDDPTGINTIKNSQTVGLYDLQGRAMSSVRKGIYIVRTKDGKTKKVMTK